MSCGPCNGAAIRSFGYSPGAFPVLHLQRLRLIRRRGLVDCLSSDQYRVSYLYVRGFDISLVVCITFHLHLLLKIPLVQLFKVVFTRNDSNGQPGTELAVRVHHVCWSDLSGAVWCCPIGTEEPVYFLLEVCPCQFAYLIKLLQYPHEQLGFCIGLRVQGCLLLMMKTQILAEVTEFLSVKRGSVVAADRLRYAKQGEGFVQPGYHCSGTG